MKYLAALALVFGSATQVACTSQDKEEEVVQEVATAETATINVGLM